MLILGKLYNLVLFNNHVKNKLIHTNENKYRIDTYTSNWGKFHHLLGIIEEIPQL